MALSDQLFFSPIRMLEQNWGSPCKIKLCGVVIMGHESKNQASIYPPLDIGFCNHLSH